MLDHASAAWPNPCIPALDPTSYHPLRGTWSPSRSSPTSCLDIGCSSPAPLLGDHHPPHNPSVCPPLPCSLYGPYQAPCSQTRRYLPMDSSSRAGELLKSSNLCWIQQMVLSIGLLEGKLMCLRRQESCSGLLSDSLKGLKRWGPLGHQSVGPDLFSGPVSPVSRWTEEPAKHVGTCGLCFLTGCF